MYVWILLENLLCPGKKKNNKQRVGFSGEKNQKKKKKKKNFPDYKVTDVLTDGTRITIKIIIIITHTHTGMISMIGRKGDFFA